MTSGRAIVTDRVPGVGEAASVAALTIGLVDAEALERCEREAARAAGLVAAFVGVPAVVAAGAVLTLFVLTAAVLLAPLVAAVLTWVAWRCNQPPRPAVTAASAGSE